MPLAVKTVLWLAVLYALIVLVAWLGQRKLLYFPDRTRTVPVDFGLAAVEEIGLQTADGERVLAWYGKARAGEPTILYFHGNGGSFPARVERFRAHLARGRGLFMMTYRGYGGSTGSPSEAANVADARLAYGTLVARGVAARDVILYGESLGTGIAVQLAAALPVGGVILESPYSSIVDVGAAAYPFLPVRQLMSDRYETMRFIGEVKAPVLVVHGDQDRLIPFAMGLKVFEAAPAPKRLIVLKGAGHVDHAVFGSFERIEKWIEIVRSGRPLDPRSVEE